MPLIDWIGLRMTEQPRIEKLTFLLPSSFEWDSLGLKFDEQMWGKVLQQRYEETVLAWKGLVFY
jgi:hypothetical protein